MLHKVLILDNYDSFTFNLYQYVGELKGNPVVYRNNEITLAGIRKLAPSHVILSPGPGSPDDPAYFGVCAEVITSLARETPVLGVCLGHQGICHYMGGKVIRAPEILHGKQSEIDHDGTGVFEGIKTPLLAMRYHSLVAERKSMPDCLRITASERRHNLVMGVQHKEWPLYGIQFHPESIGTPDGKKMLKNFLGVRKTAPHA